MTAEPGAVRCTDGHTTVGLESGPSRRGGTHAPTTIATWVAAVGPSGKCFRVVLTRRDNGSLRAAYLPWKVVPSVRYGAEPLGERAIVFTEHAVAEAQDEDITKDDIVHVFRTGTMTRVQPGLVRRIEGRDASGRTVVVCYRLNKRHEVVIITTFLNSELVGLSA